MVFVGDGEMVRTPCCPGSTRSLSAASFTTFGERKIRSAILEAGFASHRSRSVQVRRPTRIRLRIVVVVVIDPDSFYEFPLRREIGIEFFEVAAVIAIESRAGFGEDAEVVETVVIDSRWQRSRLRRGFVRGRCLGTGLMPSRYRRTELRATRRGGRCGRSWRRRWRERPVAAARTCVRS